MKLSELKEFVAESKKLFTSKTALPALDNVLVKDGYLTFSDLETTYRKKVEINQNMFGLIPFKELEKIVSKLKDCEIDFHFSSTFESVDAKNFFYDKLRIVAGKFNFNFSVSSPNEFPLTQETEIELETICAYDITLIKDAVRFSADDKFRPVTNGVYVDEENIVAADSHRLTYNRRKSASTNTFIIPKKTIKLFDENVDYSVFTDEKKQNYKFADNKGNEIIFRCIEGKYPTWKAVIPQTESVPYCFKISKKEFLESLDTALLCCNQASYLFVITTDFKNKQVTISSQDIDYEMSFSTNVGIEITRGYDDFSIGCKIPNMQLALKNIFPENALDAESVELELEESKISKKPKNKKATDEVVTFYIQDSNRAIVLNNNTLVMPMTIS